MAYDKQQVQALGAAVVDLIEAVADGVDVTDVGVGMDVLGKFMAASDELSSDKDAALLDVAAGIASTAADRRRDTETP